jgi:uncharacterized protein DUF6298
MQTDTLQSQFSRRVVIKLILLAFLCRAAAVDRADANAAENVSTASPPISTHPDNPKYFLFRGKPLILVTATEHYGSVINRPFDFERYLADAAEKHQTLTRTFLLFRELQNARNPSSPCKPESPDYIAPWRRTGPGNAFDGELRYDLEQWNPEYFDRLRRFLKRASELGIVVELTLFSNTYSDEIWKLNPLRPENSLKSKEKVAWQEYISLRHEALVARQTAYVEKIIAETSLYDNVYYEICNEPGGDFAGSPVKTADVDAWQQHIGKVAREALAKSGRSHLIFGSQAYTAAPEFRWPLDQSFADKTLDAVNVHPLANLVLKRKPYEAGYFMNKQLGLSAFYEFCRATQAFKKPCVIDEDNTAAIYRDETGWTIHRKRAWTAILSGCHYDYIDFSITVGNETGTPESNKRIRTWMKQLSDLIHSFDFVHAQPETRWIKKTSPKILATALVREGKDYLAYLADTREISDREFGQKIGGDVAMELPEGEYVARFYSPTNGSYSPGITVTGGSSPIVVKVGPFEHDIVLRITRRDSQ